MPLRELDNLLCDERQVTHVAHARLSLGLRLVAAPLALDYGVGHVGGLEEGDSERPVVASVHGSVEDLLDNVVHHVMKEVVPRVLEEE